VFLLNSRLGSFAAGRKNLHLRANSTPRLSSEVTAAVLPSSFSRILPITLVLLYHPTGVGLRYGHSHNSLEVFLDFFYSQISAKGEFHLSSA